MFDQLFKDPTLLLRLKRGDDEAYNEWFLEITSLLHAYFRRWKVHPDLLPDLAATTIADLYQDRFRGYDPERGSPGAFVALAAQRVVRNYRRDERKIETVPLDECGDLTYEPRVTAIDDYSEDDTAARLELALKPLQRCERSMVLRKFRGETISQISRRFRISESAAKCRLRRILKKLKKANQVNPGANTDP